MSGWPAENQGTRRYRAPAVVGAAGAIAMLASAGGGASAASGHGVNASKRGHASIVSALSRKYAGSSITVLLPTWGDMPKSQLAQFTAKTGIKVNLQSLAWASIHDKVASAEAAGVAPADITEVDWSWVGQFGGAGWYTNLDSLLPSSLFKSSSVAPVFVYKGQQIAMPYNLDFRSTAVNMADLKKAGITSPPRTWAQVLNDAKQLRAKGVVAHPVGLPLEVNEDTSTAWYQLVKAAGGEVLTNSDSPAFSSVNSAGGKALSFEATLYRDGLVPPGEVNLTGAQTNVLFQAGQVAIDLSTSPNEMPAFTNPSVSKVAKDDVQLIPTPTPVSGEQSKTFGLPEGLGILKQSKHKGAAAMFILWWEQWPQLLKSYEDPNMGNTPPITSAVQRLAKTGKLVAGKEVEKLLPTVKPLFSRGAPTWYPQFSTDVATQIQAVVEGHQQVSAALSTLVSQTQSLKSGS